MPARFADRGRGGVVLFGSIVGFQGTPWAAHYAATKAYVQTLAEGLAVELAGRGVDVLASAPGPTHSGLDARAGMRRSASQVQTGKIRTAVARLKGAEEPPMAGQSINRSLQHMIPLVNVLRREGALENYP